jgi:hypothetical protein
MTSGAGQLEGDRQVLGGLELDVRILARELYGGRDLTVVRRAISRMRSTLDLLAKRIGSEEAASPPGQGRSRDDPAARARQRRRPRPRGRAARDYPDSLTIRIGDDAAARLLGEHRCGCERCGDRFIPVP